MIIYKLCQPNEQGIQSCIQRLPDSSFIPLNPANTDYQAYLKWLDEGNTPLPADEE
jgi:hypothetical protein